MQIVLCPYCRCAVLPQADGSCPACRRSIPLTSAEPLVIHHGPDAASQGSSSLPRPDASNSDDVSDAEGGFDHYEIPQFWTRLLQNTPSVVVTQAIIGINVVVFLLMAVDSGALFSPSSATLIRWGANFGPRTLDGQAWRLLTSTFVHIGVIHIGLNVWVLWSIGQLVERLTGNVGFLILYVLSGLFGSLASVYRNPTVLSAGASGAVFGAFGGLMGFVLLRGDSIPRGMLGSLRNSGLSFLFYNLIFGLSIPGIDMAAHAGGLAAGFVCGLVASQPLDRVSPLTRAWRNTAMLALGLAGLGLAWRAAPPAPIDLHAHLTHSRPSNDPRSMLTTRRCAAIRPTTCRPTSWRGSSRPPCCLRGARYTRSSTAWIRSGCRSPRVRPSSGCVSTWPCARKPGQPRQTA